MTIRPKENTNLYVKISVFISLNPVRSRKDYLLRPNERTGRWTEVSTKDSLHNTRYLFVRRK